ncbi:hypothetical protein NQ314_016226 [Rhamnusium bicolor]|uniref:SWIM-type domain-containing protein n=1 Tax=Rhamnusium bicolor TaxID=1586634 RepID=A0AAV8WXK4_9CUCU|nr:hypothetical protein NQ314_016226 [Rhamnusium bicolor]
MHTVRKITKKLSELRKRHKEVDSMTNSTVILEVEDGKVWTVSSSKGLDFYSIEILNKSCNCNLRWDECNACIHAYICSCPDPAAYETIGDTNALVVDEQYENHRSAEEIVLKQLSFTCTSTSNINQYKEKVSKTFQFILSFANTIEHYKVIEKALAPILPTLTAIDSEGSLMGRNYVTTASVTAPSSSETGIRKIEPQKKVYIHQK